MCLRCKGCKGCKGLYEFVKNLWSEYLTSQGRGVQFFFLVKAIFRTPTTLHSYKPLHCFLSYY